MPQLHFIQEVRGPTVVLAHPLGCDLTVWNEVAQQLAKGFTVLRYDQRGHGRSPGLAGRCTIEEIADDAAELSRDVAVGSVHFAGRAMGGLVAQQIAVRHPELISSIVIANSSSRY